MNDPETNGKYSSQMRLTVPWPAVLPLYQRKLHLSLNSVYTLFIQHSLNEHLLSIYYVPIVTSTICCYTDCDCPQVLSSCFFPSSLYPPAPPQVKLSGFSFWLQNWYLGNQEFIFLISSHPQAIKSLWVFYFKAEGEVLKGVTSFELWFHVSEPQGN